ncbi:MAG: phage/plasmid primase, P4 family [Liquorilactobacillus nagelii]|uniref:DNA primase family protein n=1 Tax=Liquorilactobacillus nagelii TaxID=82688 RepID=UPI0039EA2BFD
MTNNIINFDEKVNNLEKDDKELPELNNQWDQKQKEEQKSDNPKWFFNNKIDHIELAGEILGENKMIKDKYNREGFFYDSKVGHWKTGFDGFLGNKIAVKLVNIHCWKTKDFSSVKILISNMIFSEERITAFENADPNLVHFKNGTYNLETDQMQKHSPSDYILNGHNYNLDMKNKPVLTDQWFNESFKDQALFMKEFIGYMFYHRYKPFNRFVILQGSGNDGKSTFLNYLRKVIGGENTSNISINDLADSNLARFNTAEMYLKELNYFADISDNFLSESNILKTLTGNDYAKAEFKRQKPFSFRNYAKLIFSANELPPFRDFTNGFERRPVIVKYHFIADFDKHFSMDQIKSEIPCFVYECLRKFKAAINRQKNGDFEGVDALSITPEMESTVSDWLKQNDHIAEFIEEYCEIEPNAWEKNVYVIEAYNRFCNQNGYQPSAKKLNERLKKLGVEPSVQKKIEGNNYRGYKGIKIIS